MRKCTKQLSVELLFIAIFLFFSNIYGNHIEESKNGISVPNLECGLGFSTPEYFMIFAALNPVKYAYGQISGFAGLYSMQNALSIGGQFEIYRHCNAKIGVGYLAGWDFYRISEMTADQSDDFWSEGFLESGLNWMITHKTGIFLKGMLTGDTSLKYHFSTGLFFRLSRSAKLRDAFL